MQPLRMYTRTHLLNLSRIPSSPAMLCRPCFAAPTSSIPSSSKLAGRRTRIYNTPPCRRSRRRPPRASSPAAASGARCRGAPHLTRCTKLLCSWFLSLLLVAGVLLFVVYLVVRPHRPRFHVAAFTAAGVQSGGGPVALSGQLTIHNPNHDLAFFFGRVYMSVQYRGDGEVVVDGRTSPAGRCTSRRGHVGGRVRGVAVRPAPPRT